MKILQYFFVILLTGCISAVAEEHFLLIANTGNEAMNKTVDFGDDRTLTIFLRPSESLRIECLRSPKTIGIEAVSELGISKAYGKWLFVELQNRRPPMVGVLESSVEVPTSISKSRIVATLRIPNLRVVQIR